MSLIPRGQVAQSKSIPRGYGNRFIYKVCANDVEGGIGDEPIRLVRVNPRKGKPQEFVTVFLLRHIAVRLEVLLKTLQLRVIREMTTERYLSGCLRMLSSFLSNIMRG